MSVSKNHLINWSFSQILFLIALAFLANSQMARAADGDLDSTFGVGGKVMTNFINNDDYGRAIAVQTDGKIIVAGQSGVYPVFHSALARYNIDGSLDQTFGVGGTVVATLDSGGETLTDIALQPDGKIVAAGTVLHDNWSVGLIAARFNSDGSLDETFASGGKVIFNFGDGSSEANAVVLQPDGKIIIVGWSGAGSYSELNDFAIARFNPNGSFDQNFGSSGKMKTHFAGEFNTGTRATSAVLQPDGKLVVVGAYKTEAVPREFALARYNTDGSLDTTFDGDGKVTTSLGAAEAFGFGVALQNDGKIVVAGYYAAGHRNHDFALARYNSNGSLDTTFGTNGRVTSDLFGASDDIAYSVAVQTDGKIVVGGRTGQYPNFKFGLARYNSLGGFDQSFGSAGRVVTEFSTVSNQSYGIALQTDGKILLAGYVITGTTGADFNTNFGVARYLSAVPHSAQFDFDGDLKADYSVFRQGTWYIDRSTTGFFGFQFGLNSDTVVPADYDGDGKTDVAVWRASDGNWYWFNSSNSTYSIVHFGASGDIPTPADYDGDGRADYAVYRAGTWYIQRSTAGLLITQFGISTDKPVPADFDGDGKTDIAVYRDGVWYINRSAQGLLVTQFGIATDRPVAADYDGDGKSDIAVWRPTEGVWYIVNSSNGAIRTFSWGASGDIPTPADYDGDGKADMTFYRGNGEWWIWRSQTNTYSAELFGANGDMPVPSAFVR
jgi:uncharacterized delta-60 repeat protein